MVLVLGEAGRVFLWVCWLRSVGVGVGIGVQGGLEVGEGGVIVFDGGCGGGL